MKKLIIPFVLSIILCTVLKSQIPIWSKKANPSKLTLNSIAFRADGRKILTGTNCHPAFIRVFDTSSTLDWNYQLGNSFMCIMGVTFSSNGNYIAAIEEFGNILIFDNSGATPIIMDTIATGTSYGFSTAISSDNSKLAVGCSNGKLLLYDLTTRTLLKTISAHPNWVTSVAFSHSNSFLISGGDDNLVKTWDLSGNQLKTFTGHLDDITGVRVSNQDSFIVSSSKDKLIKIWNVQSGTLVRTLSGHTSSVNGIDFSPDGKELVSVSSDSTARIWDFTTGLTLKTFGIKDSGALQSVAWSPLGNHIATGSDISDLVLWNVQKAPLEYQVTLSSLPTAGGNTEGAGSFKKDSTIEVIAVENSGYKFVNWTENKAIVSTLKAYSFKLTKDRTLVANFSKLNSLSITNPTRIKIYPNPTSEFILIEGEGVDHIQSTQIFDLTGKLINSPKSERQTKIDISHLPKGIYKLRVLSNESSIIHPFVKD